MQFKDVIPYLKSCINTDMRKAVTTDKTVYQIQKNITSLKEKASLLFVTTMSINACYCLKFIYSYRHYYNNGF